VDTIDLKTTRMNWIKAAEKIPRPILFYDETCEYMERFRVCFQKLPEAKHVSLVSTRNKKVFKEGTDKLHYVNAKGQAYAGPAALEKLVTEFPGIDKFSWLLKDEVQNKACEYFDEVVKKYLNKFKKK
jgi:hypothetical protein